MSTPYVGEIIMFGGNFAPLGWAFCQGQLLPIAENDVLFALIGTTYGGDGQNTFQLPDLQGRVPIHMGTGAGGTYIIGQAAGTETVTLTVSQLPFHTHTPMASSAGSGVSDPTNAYWASNPSTKQYTPLPSPVSGAVMAGGGTQPAGGNQPHDNMLPYLCVTFAISLYGVFPSQN